MDYDRYPWLVSQLLFDCHFIIKKESKAVGAHKVVRRRGLHIFQTIGQQMAVRLSKV
jgi:hypothetical protein